MEEFVEAVDSSLFVSRAFDDEEYECDFAAADLGKAGVKWSVDALECNTRTVVFAAGSLACCLADALGARGQLLARGDGGKVLLHLVDSMVIVQFFASANDARAKILVNDVLHLLSGQANAVLFLGGPAHTTALANVENPDVEIRYLSNHSDQASRSDVFKALSPPEICTGLAAAVVEQAELRGIAGSAYVALDKPVVDPCIVLRSFQNVLLTAGLTQETALTAAELADSARELADSDLDKLYL